MIKSKFIFFNKIITTVYLKFVISDDFFKILNKMELQLDSNNDINSFLFLSINSYDEESNTKYFIYNEREYEFNFDQIRKVSRFFAKYQAQYNYITRINLIQYNEIDSEISESAIYTFISLCQCEICQIKNSDIFYIYYLANKYEVTQLKKKIIQHISIHKKDLIFDYLLFKSHLSDQAVDSEDFISICFSDAIEIFANNLFEYMEEREII